MGVVKNIDMGPIDSNIELESGEVYLVLNRSERTKRLAFIAKEEAIVYEDSGESHSMQVTKLVASYDVLKKVTKNVQIMVNG